MMEVIEYGADDFSAEDEYFEILTSPEKFSEVREKLEQQGYTFMSAEVEMVPQTMAKLEDEKQKEQMERLIDNLEDLDDVTNVFYNWEQD